ncbi:hypothetical protein [Prevotella sp. oral taxon 317]|uniref:hypothetical protein n=1 Tax=Prevotella sp. oral taxon 317 TaxID=652721 RepID=UPI0001C3F7A7|nr:hypothetical protein [Prevotella sp. oral taxon 317]EFC67773.1 hypothetical protein HMPREF0670_02419 [Prevotella sp. oral taxon 317 str. F0108]
MKKKIKDAARWEKHAREREKLGKNKQKTDLTPKLNYSTIRTKKLNIKHKIYTKKTFVKK